MPANSKAQKNPVRMIWLAQKDGIETVGVRDEFKSPNHPANEKSRKYQELDLRVNNGEFTMEFYFQILGMLCKPGDIVFSAFGGSKLLIAAVVRVSNSSFPSLLLLLMLLLLLIINVRHIC